jgi:hypothetical protein
MSDGRERDPDPGKPEQDPRDAPAEQVADEGASDARAPAREAAGEAARQEGETREGGEQATGDPGSAG